MNEVEIKKFREDAIVMRLLKYLGEKGYSLSDYRAFVLRVSRDMEGFFLLSNFELQHLGAGYLITDSTRLLPLINLKLKHLFSSLDHFSNHLTITIFSIRNYDFEYIEVKEL